MEILRSVCSACAADTMQAAQNHPASSRAQQTASAWLRACGARQEASLDEACSTTQAAPSEGEAARGQVGAGLQNAPATQPAQYRRSGSGRESQRDLIPAGPYYVFSRHCDTPFIFTVSFNPYNPVSWRCLPLIKDVETESRSFYALWPRSHI